MQSFYKPPARCNDVFPGIPLTFFQPPFLSGTVLPQFVTTNTNEGTAADNGTKRAYFLSFIFQRWKRCQRLLNNTGRTGIHRRVREFDLHSLHPEISTRAKEILGEQSLAEVGDKSAGAATFYAWVCIKWVCISYC